MNTLLSTFLLPFAAALSLASFSTCAFAQAPQQELSLQAQVTREVPNDTLQVSLSSTYEGSSPRKLTQEVLGSLNAVQGQLQGLSRIHVTMGSLQVQPQWKDNKISGWSASGSMTLKSRDTALLAGELSKLSQFAQVSDVRYSLSRQARQAAQKAMLAQVSKAFVDKASDMATNLHFLGFSIVSLHLDESGTTPPIFAPRPMMLAEVRAPVGLPAQAGGSSTVSVTLRGTVQLRTCTGNDCGNETVSFGH